MADTNINQLTTHLFRHESGKMVAVLTRIFGTENLWLSEDVVQETFLTAVKVWSLKGLPENPFAWLMHVAKNKAIDAIRKNKFSSSIDFSEPSRKLLQSEYSLASQIEKLWQDYEIEDDLLRMMFTCCHNAIAAESQVALMLKTLCGFSTAEVSRAFLAPEETISKRLYRAKQFFRENKIKPEFPPEAELKAKTVAVLKAIYLIFNEGYNATHHSELIRKDLLEQAIYLCKLLCDHKHTQLPEVYAAMALMCFHASRIESRIDSEGDIILLAQQDRSKWNKELIKEGNSYLNKAAFGESLSSYHIEAAIAWQHCIAANFEDTCWQQILYYYDLLLQLHPTAVVALNRITVIYKIRGAEDTLYEMNNSPYVDEWEKYYLYYSLLGEVYAQTDKTKALMNFEKAISLTEAEAEKKLLRKKMGML